MSKLTRDDVLKLAHLSRLKLSEEEVERFRQELSSILRYVEILNSAETADLKPTYQVTGLKNIMRSDEVYDYGYDPATLLKNAPATKSGQFKVKRVIN